MTFRSVYDRALYTNSMNLKGHEYKRSERNMAAIYNKFVNSVEQMDETILIPTLLKDIDASNDVSLPNILKKCNSVNLYDLYLLLKKCKSQLDSTESLEDFQNSFLLYELKQEDEPPKPKISMDSGYWSVTSSCSDDDDLESSVSCNSEPDAPSKPYLVKNTALCVKNLCSILANLRELAEYLTHRYLESLGSEFTC